RHAGRGGRDGGGPADRGISDADRTHCAQGARARARADGRGTPHPIRCALPPAAAVNYLLGWVEPRSGETHRLDLMGFAALNPSYAAPAPDDGLMTSEMPSKPPSGNRTIMFGQA